MFRRHGKNRKLIHNIQIASLLSFVAGIVNVTGFFAVQKLTTNVTGHFAFFSDEFLKMHWFQAFSYAVYIICFLTGSFVSSFLIEMISRRNEKYEFIIPVAVELVILFAVASSSEVFINAHPNTIACILLFAMGLQNSLVTTISNSIVRTTHLTGLFTDLGIELSQLFFYKTNEQKGKLLSSIKLRCSIISFFFGGCIVGGTIYGQIQIRTLYMACTVLFAGLIYNSVKFRFLLLRRKYGSQD